MIGRRLLAAHRMRSKQVARLVLSGALVPYGNRTCLYAETFTGRPVYVEITRQQARHLSQALASAADRDRHYWQEPLTEGGTND